MCDRRRDIRHARKHFPGIDFSLIDCNSDEVYDKHHVESEHAIQQRGKLFLQWLMSCSETNIAVSSHCGLLFYMLASFGHECGESVQNYLHKGFDNCELRSIILSDTSGMSRPNPTWFPGGRMCLNGKA